MTIRILPLRNLVFYLQRVVTAAQTDGRGGELLNSWHLPLLYGIVNACNINLRGTGGGGGRRCRENVGKK